MVSHFIQQGHSPDDLKFFVIAQLKQDPNKKIDIIKCLNQLEAKWIFKFQSVYPQGLNAELDLTGFI